MNEQLLKHKIKEAAKALEINFNEAWHILVLERFLAGISASQYRDKLIFKGGLLLARYVDLGRETHDLDFLLQKLQAEKSNIEGLMNDKLKSFPKRAQMASMMRLWMSLKDA